MRRADVEEASAVWKFHYIIDMRINADVFVEVSLGVFNGDARAGFGGVGAEGGDGEEQDEPRDWALGHCGRMLAGFGGIGCAPAHCG